MGYDDNNLLEAPIINNHIVTAPSDLIVLGDEYVQPFETPQNNNHSVTAPIAYNLIESDSPQYQLKNRTHMPDQKLNLPGKYYLCFQMDGGTSHAAQCDKSRALTKMIELIRDIESF